MTSIIISIDLSVTTSKVFLSISFDSIIFIFTTCFGWFKQLKQGLVWWPKWCLCQLTWLWPWWMVDRGWATKPLYHQLLALESSSRECDKDAKQAPMTSKDLLHTAILLDLSSSTTCPQCESYNGGTHRERANLGRGSQCECYQRRMAGISLFFTSSSSSPSSPPYSLFLSK